MRPHHGGMKRARPQSMPTSEALPQAYSGYTGERALVGRILLMIIQSKAYAASWLNTTLETCGSISEVASFSSSLKFYLVRVWLTSYGLLDGFKFCKILKLLEVLERVDCLYAAVHLPVVQVFGEYLVAAVLLCCDQKKRIEELCFISLLQK